MVDVAKLRRRHGPSTRALRDRHSAERERQEHDRSAERASHRGMVHGELGGLDGTYAFAGCGPAGTLCAMSFDLIVRAPKEPVTTKDWREALAAVGVRCRFPARFSLESWDGGALPLRVSAKAGEWFRERVVDEEISVERVPSLPRRTRSRRRARRAPDLLRGSRAESPRERTRAEPETRAELSGRRATGKLPFFPSMMSGRLAPSLASRVKHPTPSAAHSAEQLALSGAQPSVTKRMG